MTGRIGSRPVVSRVSDHVRSRHGTCRRVLHDAGNRSTARRLLAACGRREHEREDGEKKRDVSDHRTAWNEG